MDLWKNGYLKILIVSINLMSLGFAYTIPELEFELLSPIGFRAWIPAEEGIVLFAFHGALNHEIIGTQPGDFSGEVVRPTNGKFIYENTKISLNNDDEIHYWVHVQHKNKGIRMMKKVYKVGRTPIPVILPVTTAPPSIDNCKTSITRVRGQAVCQGDLIFEDHFDRLNWTKWKRDIRIPLDTDDADFVSFQDRPENCYISNGILYIVPNLLTEVPGFTELDIRRGTLSLENKCTGIVNKDLECMRQAGKYMILPPVVSAKIRSAFSFKYGIIEIRCKLVKGDWLFPQIFLEPYTYEYGIRGYASGQMRVAFIRGNEILQDKNGYPIDGRRIYGGAVLTTGDSYRNEWLQESVRSEHLGNGFHTYKLIWTDDALSMSIDGEEYGTIAGGFSNVRRTHNINYASQWQNGGYMAPFDQEFYISLGVSAGGISDFPDGCRTGRNLQMKCWGNASPKAELNFYSNHSDWYSTWKGQDSGLQVDYIKVWAL